MGVRQRKTGDSSQPSSKESLAKSKEPEKKPESRFDSKFVIFVIFNAVVVLCVIIYMGYLHYLETWVVTPLNLPKVVTKSDLEVPDRYWGSYRSPLYFGLKTRSSRPLSVGLMWFPQALSRGVLPVRHWCSKGDGLAQYGWLRHDGVNFGIQSILDGEYKIETSFVKRAGGRNGGDWTARIGVKPRKKNATVTVPISLLFYVATDGHGRVTPSVDVSTLHSVHGESDELGKFQLRFVDREPKQVMHHNFLSTVATGMHTLKETVVGNIVAVQGKKGGPRLYFVRGHNIPSDKNVQKRVPNFILTQVTVQPPYEMEVVFESASFEDRENSLEGEEYDAELLRRVTDFEEKFERLFGLSAKSYTQEERNMAKEILSNTLGGIGYFHGSSLVQSAYNKEPVEYWPASLYTAVPSRSSFPRGFLWDEGFHNLLISRWDAEISKDILAHWLDLANVDGWIPREQILGLEARAQVPAEFVVQRDTNANPPALLLAFETLLNSPEAERDVAFFRRAFPRLLRLFHWLNTTQVGKLPGTYRWRGRAAASRSELNPKTLTSGLDDYPRASHPSDDERHVDLRCWMALAARILARMAEVVGESPVDLVATARRLSDPEELDKLHWSPVSESYCDYGLHTDRVKLVNQKTPPGQHPPQHLPKVRLALESPALRFVQHFGYVSLFPLLLQVLPSDSPTLGKLLSDLRQPSLLWTDYGLRSLAKTSPLYMKYNTEVDPPYWRGPIWINVNYLAVRALYHYSQLPGPHQEQAFALYKELRKNVVDNVLREYRCTKYIWEQYQDTTGKGQGAHPFTGWSALVVLLMGERY
ncbi:mannosyl-oligosaccharide glucosidase-like isoform X2 [Ornithodoros turicata]